MKKPTPKVKILSCFIAVAGAILFCVWQNNSLEITRSKYVNTKIPEEFSGLKIAHISDLHNKSFGKNQGTILNKLQNISPHIIVITGDLIDRRRYDLETALVFARGAVDIAPVYYVPGNHEAWSNRYQEIKEGLELAGVHILDNQQLEIEKGDSKISILGVRDPGFVMSDHSGRANTTELAKNLKEFAKVDNFKILLSHRPELFELYCKNNMDLIFTGHAHGGQIRIPLVGGIIAPNQGLFPKYTDGSHTKDNSTMLVSRGLGNSLFPIRVFNRPEIVVVTLENKLG